MKNIEKQVKILELELLKPEIRKDKNILNKLLSSDFIEFTSLGIVSSKKDIIKRLPNQKDLKWVVINLKTKILSNDIVLVTYKVKKIDLKENNKTISLRSSVWKNNNSNWQMVFHQGTLLN